MHNVLRWRELACELAAITSLDGAYPLFSYCSRSPPAISRSQPICRHLASQPLYLKSGLLWVDDRIIRRVCWSGACSHLSHRVLQCKQWRPYCTAQHGAAGIAYYSSVSYIKRQPTGNWPVRSGSDPHSSKKTVASPGCGTERAGEEAGAPGDVTPSRGWHHNKSVNILRPIYKGEKGWHHQFTACTGSHQL